MDQGGGNRRIGSANHLQELNRALSLVDHLNVDSQLMAVMVVRTHWRCARHALTWLQQKRRTRHLRLDLSGSRRGRGYARIGTGSKPVVANTLSGCITETGRKRRLFARRN